MAAHTFAPARYYTTMGPHDPALCIFDGDTVTTTTVDARGHGATGEQITPGGNPQTGPFYVEGAEPGDTLAIHLDRLSPNRDVGWSATSLAQRVVDPDFVREVPERTLTEWRIDRTQGTARLMDAPGGLRDLTLALAPMLGCFGVAPSGGQAISTATSAEHGGNMDYRGFTAGVTVYFPVFVAGALFFVGDGHALQGDGEIVGTGIEISFDVQFTARLLKGKGIGWPRGENADYIFSVGNARPLDQALQHATTEMSRWLVADYGLDVRSVHTLMGQCVEYDVGNVVDPAYTMVCKMPKRVLNGIAKP
ncbi:MAG: acetamidase/formamidase family protein [Chloroflexota bacterium]